MQAKTTMRSHHAATRMAKLKRQTLKRMGVDVEALELSHTATGKVKQESRSGKTVWQLLKKLYIRLSYAPANLLSEIFSPKQSKYMSTHGLVYKRLQQLFW